MMSDQAFEDVKQLDVQIVKKDAKDITPKETSTVRIDDSSDQLERRYPANNLSQSP